MNKIFVAEIKSGSAGSRQLTYTISTTAPDRSNDRVLGFDLSNYRKNPVVMFAHDYKSLPVGKTTSINQVGDSLIATVQFVPADISPVAQQCYQLASKGFMRGASIGFKPIVGQVKTNDLGGYDYSKVELLEWSLVPVPAHPDALRRSAGGNSRPDREIPDSELRGVIERYLDSARLSKRAARELTDAETAALVVSLVFGSGAV
jgi:HK97 family phage prohead protease